MGFLGIEMQHRSGRAAQSRAARGRRASRQTAMRTKPNNRGSPTYPKLRTRTRCSSSSRPRAFRVALTYARPSCGNSLILGFLGTQEGSLKFCRNTWGFIDFWILSNFHACCRSRAAAKWSTLWGTGCCVLCLILTTRSMPFCSTCLRSIYRLSRGISRCYRIKQKLKLLNHHDHSHRDSSANQHTRRMQTQHTQHVGSSESSQKQIHSSGCPLPHSGPWTKEPMSVCMYICNVRMFVCMYVCLFVCYSMFVCSMYVCM